MLHNFDLSLKHEREQTAKADEFYRDVLKVDAIIRFNSDSESDMEMQRQDVDCVLKLNGLSFRVSEKFRDKDYGDMYIEIYSKFPATKGWLHTGTPNAILYFTPLSVYWITHKSLSNFCLFVLFPLIPEKWYDELIHSGVNIISKRIKFQNAFQKINLILASNYLADGTKWNTVGLSTSFSFLENNQVKIKKFTFK